MALPKEREIMAKIGLGNNYSWFNGSGSCGDIRYRAIQKLPEVARSEGLTVSDEWLKACKMANRADQMDGDRYTLTNTWVACSYAIADAICRQQGGDGINASGFKPTFFRRDKEAQWNSLRGFLHQQA